MSENLRKTPLHAWHVEHGARMAPFAGFDMPVQYAGIIKEHEQTRNRASIFDICHMGEFMVRGPGARDALSRVLTHNLATLAPGKCRYGFMLNERGGVIDDLIAYCVSESEYMLVVNGACEDKDFEWVKSHLPGGVLIENVSDATAKIDVQGPLAIDKLEAALEGSWRHLKYFNFQHADFLGERIIVSRTGYTGELGYEIYLPAHKALEVWERFAALDDVEPAGLGARDTLRLEMGYPLYGHDLDEDHTPVEAGYDWMLSSESDYVGKDALGDPRELLCPLAVDGRRSPRHEDPVHIPDGPEAGRVTSGSFSPSLGHAIALAWIEKQAAERKLFSIKGARAMLEARRVRLPFYDGGTARKKLG